MSPLKVKRKKKRKTGNECHHLLKSLCLTLFCCCLDLVATAKNVYTGITTAGSKANQTHKMVEVRLFEILASFLC